MKKEDLVKKYKEKSEENFKLYEFLAQEKRFVEWQAVSIFYSALCYVKAYLYSMPNMPEESITSHKSIMYWLTTERNAKNLMIFEKYYNFLYNYSRDARYKYNKINEKIVTRMLEKYREIKKLLSINL